MPERWSDKPNIILTPVVIITGLRPAGGTGNAEQPSDAEFLVALQGVEENQELEISFWEVDSERDKTGKDQKFASVKGTVTVAPDVTNITQLTLKCSVWEEVPASKREAPQRAADVRPASVTFDFGIVECATLQARTLTVPVDWYDRYGRDGIEVQARIETKGFEARSISFLIGDAGPHLAVGTEATYDWHEGNSVTLYNDGSRNEHGTEGAFADMLKAIKEAEEFIFIADWSFHPYFRVDRANEDLEEGTIGKILCRKAVDPATATNMLIAIHTWDHTDNAAPDEQNESGGDRLDRLAGGARPGNLLWRKGCRTGGGWTHHQKFIVVDCPGPDGKRDLKAFFGGLDLTKGRFDWGMHMISDERDGGRADYLKTISLVETSERRNWPYETISEEHEIARYDDWYNAELGDDRKLPRQPWHDIHGCIQGPAAWDILQEFVARWRLDPSIFPFKSKGDTSEDSIKKVVAKLQRLLDREKIPDLIQQYENPRSSKDFPFTAQVYRSMKKDHVSSDSAPPILGGPNNYLTWLLPGETEQSIQLAYLKAIARAEDFIYIETQYLISSGDRWNGPLPGVANGIAQALVDRIRYHKSRGHDFHVYIICPMFPEGDPVSIGGHHVRMYEWKTMDYMVREVGSNWENYLSFFFLAKSTNKSCEIATLTTYAQEGSESDVRRGLLKKNQRYMIYVHSKLMIVDDRYLILGSANLNERSLAGDRDSEICIGIWPSTPHAVEAQCIATIKQLRVDLFAEHLDGLNAAVGSPGSCVFSKTVRSTALLNYKLLRTGQALNGHLMMLPLELRKESEYTTKIITDRYGFKSGQTLATNSLAGSDDVARLRVKKLGLPGGDDYLPDAPSYSAEWLWWCTDNWNFIYKKWME